MEVVLAPEKLDLVLLRQECDSVLGNQRLLPFLDLNRLTAPLRQLRVDVEYTASLTVGVPPECALELWVALQGFLRLVDHQCQTLHRRWELPLFQK